MALDVPPACRPLLGNPAVPLYVTEGARKADAAASQGLCCIALLGVWNWRGSNEVGGKTALADWESIALNDREVGIVFDSDVMTKTAVHAALGRLKAFLESRGARVRVIYLPPEANGNKVGLDDYLATGHGVTDVLALATTELRQPPTGGDHSDGPYRMEHGRLFWLRPTREGMVTTELANFTVMITNEIIEDDGTDDTRVFFEMTASLKGREFAITVSASRFGTMNWVVEQLGAEAVLPAGFGLRDHARAAIQSLSHDVARRRVYTHTGWRHTNDGWVYLHGRGAIGVTDGCALETRLPAPLARYELPDPPIGHALHTCVRASLGLVGAGGPPAAIVFPLYAAIWRAVLAPADFSIHLSGPTGVFKSELAALAQQHWGPGLDARHLPGAWSSTGNSLEGLAFHAKDAIVVVDDFAPHGTTNDVQRMHRDADRVLRAQGNQAGRQRMRADTTLRPAKPPRGLIVSTGEEIPHGQSLRARVLVLDVAPGAIDSTWLSRCQRAATAGLYAQALAAFVAWAAPRYGLIRDTWATDLVLLRGLAAHCAAHRRTPEIIANLALGFGWFLVFAYEAGLDIAAVEQLWHCAWTALGEGADAQAQHQAGSEPTQRFLELLGAALTNGTAHLTSPDGGAPANGGAYGWRTDTFGDDVRDVARGDQVGWVDGDDLYLEPEAAYAAVQRLARTTGDSFPISSATLKRRMHERGLLESTETRGGKLRFDVRRTLNGRRRPVLHLALACLNADEVAPVAQDGRTANGNAAVRWATVWAARVDVAAHAAAGSTHSRDGDWRPHGPSARPSDADDEVEL